jgi:general secretion pathway protein K
MAAHVQQRRPGRRGERGAALLVAVVAVAILTALAVDLAYETRVSLEIAASARDELRAEYLAKSGVAMSRFVLGFQERIDDAAQQMCGGLSAVLGGNLPGGGQQPNQPAQNPAGAGMACPRIQLWSAVPVSSGLVQALFGGGPAPAPAAAGQAPKARFGDFEGAFDAKIEDEGKKASVNIDGLATGILGPQVQALYQVVCDPKWDRLFDREDANGVKATRQDWLVYLRDWVDFDEPNEVSSTLAASFPGQSCTMIVTGGHVFENGFGDENQPYDKGEDRYKTKNARFDSLDELHLVAGVSDAFMAAFGDRLTVYLPQDAPRNVNTMDPRELVQLAALVADPPGQPMLADPALGEKLRKAVADVTMGGLLTINQMQFAAIVQALGVSVSTANLAANGPKQFLTDRSYVFQIRSTGSAGAVTKTIDAVLSYDPKQNQTTAQQTSDALAQAQQQGLQLGAVGNQMQTAAAAVAQAQGLQQAAAQAQGAEKPSRLLHWREE